MTYVPPESEFWSMSDLKLKEEAIKYAKSIAENAYHHLKGHYFYLGKWYETRPKGTVYLVEKYDPTEDYAFCYAQMAQIWAVLFDRQQERDALTYAERKKEETLDVQTEQAIERAEWDAL